MVRFRREIIFVAGFWWLWDILSTSLTNLVCPKLKDRYGEPERGE
jgi:hypothetical protein